MPRHPPCALHNNSHNTHTTRTTHQRQASHRCAIRQYHQVNKHTTTKNCITKKRRYSRPLYSSHTTQTAHTPATPVTMPCTIFHGDIMLQTPNRRNKPSPKTHTVCPQFFKSHQLPTTGQPPNTYTPPTTNRGWRCTVERLHLHGMCFSTHKSSSNKNSLERR